jgi:hypothetical protein
MNDNTICDANSDKWSSVNNLRILPLPKIFLLSVDKAGFDRYFCRYTIDNLWCKKSSVMLEFVLSIVSVNLTQ